MDLASGTVFHSDLFGFVLYLVLCQDFRKNRMFRVKEVEAELRCSVESQEDFLMKRHGTARTCMEQDYEEPDYV